MDMLQDLLGGQRRQEYDDFASRYDQGDPWDGISDEEAAQRYDEIAPRLSDDDYRSSAAEAFERLSPQQRAEFGRWLNQQSRERGYQSPYGDDDDFTDSNRLAEYTARVRQDQPDLLGSLVGGMLGGGGMSGGGTFGAGLTGGGMSGGGMSGGGGLLGSPIAKAALGGIAAMAFRKMSGR